MPVTAMVEAGHGIFDSTTIFCILITLFLIFSLLDRQFTTSDFFSKEANRQGWVLWGMDYRGFTSFDFPEMSRLVFSDIMDAAITIKGAATQVM